MPKSIFSKLQARLRRLPRLEGGPDSTDEEEQQEEARQGGRCLNTNGLLLEDDLIVDSAPRRSSPTERRRAVRFSEAGSTDPDPGQQHHLPHHPPVPSPPQCPAPPPNCSSPLTAVQGQFIRLSPSTIHGEGPPSVVAQNPLGSCWSDELLMRENAQPPRPVRNSQQGRRAMANGQPHRREEDGWDDCATANYCLRSPVSSLFLEFQGEIKRSGLPPNMRSVAQLKGLFLRCFPALSASQLHSTSVKVYIRNPDSPHRLFYELEVSKSQFGKKRIGKTMMTEIQMIINGMFAHFHYEKNDRSDDRNLGNQNDYNDKERPSQPLRRRTGKGATLVIQNLQDLQDQSLLRLFEQSPQQQATIFPAGGGVRARIAHQPAVEYLSEPEMATDRTGAGPARELLLVARPASVLANGGGRRRGPVDLTDSWALGSDSSSSGQYPRSGSNTPQPMREAAGGGGMLDPRRVDSLERQLASLCSLVHSALLPSWQRGEQLMSADWTDELGQFREQILDYGGHGDLLDGAHKPDPPNALIESNTSTIFAGSINCPADDGDGRRSMLSGRVMGQLSQLREELSQLREEVQRNSLAGMESVRKAVGRVRDLTGVGTPVKRSGRHWADRMEKVMSALRTFEANLENTRSAVLNSNRRLKMCEVDNLAAKLGEIGREAVELKISIPSVKRGLDDELGRTMRTLTEDKLALKEKALLVDACLRRCKTLANLMVTMKKLALVQDEPSPHLPVERMAGSGGPSQQQRRAIPTKHISLGNCGQPQFRQAQTKNNLSSGGSHPLDAILDELNANVADPSPIESTNEISASLTLRLAAKPTHGNVFMDETI